MADKIVIASLTDDMGLGGTARQIITIDRYLNKDIFEHFIISLSSQSDAMSKFINSKKVFLYQTPKK